MLIDQSAACDTVWQAGLMMKLSKAIKCRTTIRRITSHISQRNFRVFLGNQVSRKRILKNGISKGSVLAPSVNKTTVNVGGNMKLYAGADEIIRNECCKFLGTIIDDKLGWLDHINSTNIKLSRSLYILN